MEMEKDIVILLEDEKNIREGFQKLFVDLDIDMDIVLCEKPEDFEAAIAQDNVRDKLKALIMDLSNTQKEATSKAYKAADYIRKEYEGNRIPIFIHSGNLHHYKELDDKGTVFKIEKNKDSIQSICEDIKLMRNSGFLDIFCNNGSLDKKIVKELHSAFTSQFKNTEIKEIIKSIEVSSEEDMNKLKGRAREVFERIAIRSLYANLISAKQSEGENSIVEIKLNSIEHYYRRTSSFDFWTGDIFLNEGTQEMCVVVTPRCNVGHNNFDELLLCKISLLNEDTRSLFLKPSKGVEEFKKNITDDKKVGDRHRFLPPSPQFTGGFVDYKTVFSIHAVDFKSSYSYLISLSDELTNDVVRKLGAYLMRGGISETDLNESLSYLKCNSDK